MEFDSISEQVVYLRSRGVHHNTLVHNYSVYKGSQSVLFVLTDCSSEQPITPRRNHAGERRCSDREWTRQVQFAWPRSPLKVSIDR